MNFNHFSQVSKYRNKKETLDGHVFDSKKEGSVYLELKAALAKGEIKKLELQKRFELIPNQTEIITVTNKKGKTIEKEKVIERAIDYIADFVIEYPDGEVSVIDCKGMRLTDYRMKRKLMRYFHGIKIKEV
jgi:hypothetical protein